MEVLKGWPEKAAKATLVLAALGFSLASQSACAFDVNTGVPGLETTFNTDLRYTVGLRTASRDEAIGNGIFFDEGDYRFDQGDVVTNRVDATPQLNLSYSPQVSWLSSFGARITGNAFEDFVYGSKRVRARDGSAPSSLPAGLLGPNQAAIPTPGFSPPVPYSELVSYESGHYGSATKERNVRHAEVQDAFVFANFTVFHYPVNVKIGQHALFWGEALFNPFFGVAYGLGPIDINKALTIPAINAQDLFVPVKQASGNVVLHETLSLGFQYFLDWRRLRAPEGGTYLSPADPFLEGPDRLFLGNLPVTGPYFSPRAANVEADNHDNFGLQLKWDATENATIGLYYRRFDETLPWIHVAPATPETQPNVFGNLQALLDGLGQIFGGPVDPATLPTLPGSYRLVYAEKTQLFGLSGNTKLLGISFAGEVVYNKNRALLSELLNREDSGRKTRGNLWSGVVNGLYLFNNVDLFGTRIFDQGPVIVEFNWSYLDKVAEREDVYKKVGSDSCKRDAALFGATGVDGDTVDWCASRYHVGVAAAFVPTWFQVFPGIDLNALVFYQNTFKNTSAANLAAAEGYGNGSVGFGATFRQALQASLNYNFFFSDFRRGTNLDGETTITSFNGIGTLDDRDYVSLTLKYSF